MYVSSILRLSLRAPLFARGIRGGRRPRELAEDSSDLSLDDFEKFDKLKEEEVDFVRNVENPQNRPQEFHDEERRRRKVKHKIIERHHFKAPSEVNLLTWDAKEQIRYLHNEFPDEWTVDRLAESFPISREGVIRILRSKFVPESVERIIQHDKNVHERWLELKSGKEESMINGGPVASRYQHLLAEGKVHLLQHAAGHRALPAPKGRSASAAMLNSEPTRNDSGIFHSIVKDYCERKRQQNQSDEKEQLKLASDTNRKLLANVTKTTKFSKKSKDVNKELMNSFSYSDDNMQENLKNTEVKIAQTLLDVKSTQKDRKTLKKSNPKRADRAEVSEIDPVKDNLVDEHFENDIEFTRKPKTEPVSGTDLEFVRKKKQILQEIKYESARNKSRPDAYRFDHQLGYHHPLGKVTDQPDHVKIRQSLRKHRDSLYQKGDSFYDDSGDFLFRVPGLPEK